MIVPIACPDRSDNQGIWRARMTPLGELPVSDDERVIRFWCEPEAVVFGVFALVLNSSLPRPRPPTRSALTQHRGYQRTPPDCMWCAFALAPCLIDSPGRCRNSCALTDSPLSGCPVIVGLRARRDRMSARSGVDVDPPAAQREDPLRRPRHARMWVSRADLVRLACWTSYLVNRNQRWSTAPPRQFVHHRNEVAVSQGQPPRWRRGRSAVQRVGGRQLPLRLQRADREMERLILESGSGTSPELQLCADGRSQRFTGRRVGCWHPW